MTTSLAQLADQLESSSSRDRLLALAALRDIPADDAVPLIKKVLWDENLQIRSMAVFALGVKPTAECFGLLVQLLETEPDYGIRADAAGALGYLEDERAFEPLIRAFYEDTDWLVRFSAAVSLGNLKDPRGCDALLSALESDQVLMLQGAIAALGEIGNPAVVDHLLRFVQSDDWLIRQRLAEALGNLPHAKGISALKYLAKDENSQVAEAAQLSLERLA
ncbi:HEAT repeat domain-containing protein [Candidatus Synechococcus calcipolaris G9]|uniref:HEAT repeat domain-containing protein n=1 Tax=Candidatus Synechococcus calcipolaris G9 TaxID=1497997 RepID=A0ABT6EZ87_9SYNE|nr:HEAT repeat domain-containing protein [Candidatus Synechococcus calcipolaris]MDG2990898.1 HEAT repeat domain-containing protein [Candidatus Synechococcus calcipolaris G9]